MYVDSRSRTIDDVAQFRKQWSKHERQIYREVSWCDLKATVEEEQITAQPMDMSWQAHDCACTLAESERESLQSFLWY